MYMAKQGQKAHSGRIVKHSHAKQFVVAATLAIIGIVVYVLLQQYTYQAKLEAELNNKRTQVQSQLKDLETKNNINADQQKQIDELNKQKQDLEKQLQAKLDAKKRTTAVASLPTVTGDKTAWLIAAGIPESDWGYVDYIVSHEGGWNGTTKYNYGGSGAYGLCQALPGGKMASAGADWQTNPVTQLKWCSSYATGRYGSWAGAYQAWLRQNWW